MIRFIRIPIEKIPAVKAHNMPAIRLASKATLAESIEKTSNSVAPKIAGIDSKNENLAASSLLSPTNKAPTIVDPDLEIPGAMAKP